MNVYYKNIIGPTSNPFLQCLKFVNYFIQSTCHCIVTSGHTLKTPNIKSSPSFDEKCLFSAYISIFESEGASCLKSKICACE